LGREGDLPRLEEERVTEKSAHVNEIFLIASSRDCQSRLFKVASAITAQCD
jgi:hypothetical protein